ncbi:MAG TPA: hypothetical protein VGP55_02565 [Chitinophagaceae bacterium]|nr:hypothetical protein [Chitinophagaceae bacterium]
MSIISKLFQFFLIGNLIYFVSCNVTRHNKSGVEGAMKYYDHLILNLNADSISLLYTPDGCLGDIATGRDSIRKFLSSFVNVSVLSQISTTQSINIVRDTAIQKGTYNQVDLIGGKDTVKVKGDYTTTWQWIPRQGWHIKRMATKPAN